MPQEIERKFLIAGDFRPQVEESTHIVQGYLSSAPERNVRVRLKGEKGYLTVKGMGNESGTTRFEWETEITREDAEALIGVCEPGVIDKTRHLVRVGQHVFEVDSFEKPAWLGQEVTGDPRYYNAMLMKQPYRTWPR
jgi:adenylate cyclase